MRTERRLLGKRMKKLVEIVHKLCRTYCLLVVGTGCVLGMIQLYGIISGRSQALPMDIVSSIGTLIHQTVSNEAKTGMLLEMCAGIFSFVYLGYKAIIVPEEYLGASRYLFPILCVFVLCDIGSKCSRLPIMQLSLWLFLL